MLLELSLAETEVQTAIEGSTPLRLARSTFGRVHSQSRYYASV